MPAETHRSVGAKGASGRRGAPLVSREKGGVRECAGSFGQSAEWGAINRRQILFRCSVNKRTVEPVLENERKTEDDQEEEET